jgi:Flp pilus assembly protein TadG
MMRRRLLRRRLGSVGRLGVEDGGQILPFVALMLVALLAMTGITIDVGRLLYVRNKLQSSTDAAALAGAATLPASDAAAIATRYGGVTGSLNATTNLTGVTMVSGYPKVLCLATLTTEGMACASPGNGNALQVREQVTVSLLFLRVIGISTLTVGAVSTASSKGAARAPYNVAIIVDTTGSMGSTDSDSSCNATRLSCALAGVQVLLQNLSPCAASLTVCGTATSGMVANPVDQVALYTFPALATATDAMHEYDCSGKTPAASYYTDPTLPIYQVLGFTSDYKLSASATTPPRTRPRPWPEFSRKSPAISQRRG